jgi:hypothetical protein
MSAIPIAPYVGIAMSGMQWMGIAKGPQAEKKWLGSGWQPPHSWIFGFIFDWKLIEVGIRQMCSIYFACWYALLFVNTTRVKNC